MFKKLIASVGIGSAKVDTIVKTEQIFPDSMIDLEVVIEGGSVEQDLNGLTVALCTSMQEEFDGDDVEFDYDSTLVISRVAVPLENTIIQPNERLVFEVQMHVHAETPITALRSKSAVWLKTGLDIENGVDSSDKDYLNILLPPLQERLLGALQELGYNLVKIDTERGTLRGDGFNSTIGCYQEFEFKSNGFFSNKEVEVSFLQGDDMVGVVLEIDRSFGGDSYRSAVIPMDASFEDISNWLRDNIG